MNGHLLTNFSNRKSNLSPELPSDIMCKYSGDRLAFFILFSKYLIVKRKFKKEEKYYIFGY